MIILCNNLHHKTRIPGDTELTRSCLVPVNGVNLYIYIYRPSEKWPEFLNDDSKQNILLLLFRFSVQAKL